VARGLIVSCSCCPDGERLAVVTASIKKIVVCKHAAAALKSVVDSLAKYLGTTALTTVSKPIQQLMIDGAPLNMHVFAGTRGSGCEECGFSDWNAGDRKYVVEQCQNKDSHQHGAREHLCPPCAVTRGLL
jgi:hypothetical protein